MREEISRAMRSATTVLAFAAGRRCHRPCTVDCPATRDAGKRSRPTPALVDAAAPAAIVGRVLVRPDGSEALRSVIMALFTNCARGSSSKDRGECGPSGNTKATASALLAEIRRTQELVNSTSGVDARAAASTPSSTSIPRAKYRLPRGRRLL